MRRSGGGGGNGTGSSLFTEAGDTTALIGSVSANAEYGAADSGGHHTTTHPGDDDAVLAAPEGPSSELVLGAGAENPRYEADARASGFAGIFNLANAAIGAGVLAFPYAYRLTGWVAGIVLTAVVASVMMYTQYVLAVATRATRSTGYPEMLEKALGSKMWGLLGTVVLIVYLLGALVAYMKVVGDQAVPIAVLLFGKHSFFASTYFIIPVLSVVLILPLNMLPRVDKLGPASIFAVCACAYVAVFVWVQGIINWSDDQTKQMTTIDLEPGFFAGVPLITFAFTSHALVPTVFAAIKGHSTEKFKRTIVLSTLVCALLYVPTGIFGYLSFGNDTDGDILVNFPPKSPFADIGRAAMTITVVLAYPINHLPARTAIIAVFFPHRDNRPFDVVYMVTTFAVFLITLVLAVAVPKLQTVFGMFGAVLGVCLVFLFPALLNYRYATPGRKGPALFGSIFIALVGMFVLIAGGTMTMVLAIDPSKATSWASLF